MKNIYLRYLSFFGLLNEKIFINVLNNRKLKFFLPRAHFAGGQRHVCVTNMVNLCKCYAILISRNTLYV